jgi:sialic acid synthase SpsE
LATITELRSKVEVPVGYSDHTIGMEACVVATGLGASIVEKHLTLAHDFSDFRDHALSAEPGELAELRCAIDLAAKLLGETRVGVLAIEVANLRGVRRSLVASRNLAEGEVLTLDDLVFVRPGDGLPLAKLKDVIGRRVRCSIKQDTLLRLEDLE